MKASRAIKIIQAQFPEIEAETIKQLNSGSDRNVFLVNDNLVFKFPLHRRVADNLTREFLALEQIDKLNLNVPRIFFSGITNKFSKSEFSGYKYVKGEALTPEIYAGLTEEEKKAAAKALGKFLKQLHTIEASKVKDLSIDVKRKIEEDYQLLKKVFWKKLTAQERARVDSIYETILKNKNFFKYSPVLTHGYLTMKHLLIDLKTKKIVGVIDFEEAMVSDPDKDFYYMLTKDAEKYGGTDFAMNVIKAYGHQNKENLLKKAEIFNSYRKFAKLVHLYNSSKKKEMKASLKNIKEFLKTV